jgi:hypothetical protein
MANRPLAELGKGPYSNGLRIDVKTLPNRGVTAQK